MGEAQGIAVNSYMDRYRYDMYVEKIFLFLLNLSKYFGKVKKRLC